MDDVGSLSIFLNDFVARIDAGFGLLQGQTESLMAVLLVLNIVVSGFYWMFSNDAGAGQFVRKTITIAVIIWIIRNWGTLTYVVYTTFIDGGLQAGGGTLSPNEFLDPGAIAVVGVDIAVTLSEKITALTGPVAFFKNIVEIAVLGFAYVLVMMAFFVLAIQVFFAILIFHIGALLALLTMPFAVFKPTAWIAERPVAWVFSAGLRIASLALVVGLAQTLFVAMAPGTLDEITIQRTMAIILASGVIFAAAVLAPKFASDLIGGGPTFGAGAFLGAGAAAAAGGAALASGAASALGASRVAASATGAGMSAAAPVATTATRVASGKASSADLVAAFSSARTSGKSWVEASRAGRQAAGSRLRSSARYAGAAGRLLGSAGSGGGGGAAPSF